MRTRVQKWGNSLALRIPKSFADEVGLAQDSAVELSLVSGKLVIKPVVDAELTLNQLLTQISAENMHNEVDMGPAMGNEAW